MAKYAFSAEKKCPKCGAGFAQAEQRQEYDPVVVVTCPSCNQLLWRPGSDEGAALVEYDPNADAGGI